MNTYTRDEAIHFAEDFIKDFFAGKALEVSGPKMRSVISAGIFLLFLYHNASLDEHSSFEDYQQKIDYLAELHQFFSDVNFRNAIRKTLIPDEEYIAKKAYQSQFLFSQYIHTVQSDMEAELAENTIIKKMILDAFLYLDLLGDADLQQMQHMCCFENWGNSMVF